MPSDLSAAFSIHLFLYMYFILILFKPPNDLFSSFITGEVDTLIKSG